MNYTNKVYGDHHIPRPICLSPKFWRQEGGKIMSRPSHIFLMDQNHRKQVSDCVKINEEYLSNLTKLNGRIVTVKPQTKYQRSCPACKT